MLSLRYRSQIFLTRRRKNTKNYDVSTPKSEKSKIQTYLHNLHKFGISLSYEKKLFQNPGLQAISKIASKRLKKFPYWPSQKPIYCFNEIILPISKYSCNKMKILPFLLCTSMGRKELPTSPLGNKENHFFSLFIDWR